VNNLLLLYKAAVVLASLCCTENAYVRDCGGNILKEGRERMGEG